MSSVILKACEMLAVRSFETSAGLMFHEAGISGPKMLAIDIEQGDQFMQEHRQYDFQNYGHAEYKVSIRSDKVFNNEHGAMQTFCTECGYDQFEVLTVIRREALLFVGGITSIKPLSKDHLSTCLCCGRKIHVEIHS